MFITDNPRIGVLGDIHGNGWIVNRAIRSVSTYTDTLVQVGDFGLHSNKELKNISYEAVNHGVKVVFIPGNHEHFPKLSQYSSTITELKDNVFYAPKGSVGTIGGFSALFMGGATSIDKQWRTPGVDWFEEEEINQEEKELGISRGKCDVMFTHDAPLSVDIPESCLFNTDELKESVIEEAYNHREVLQEVVDSASPEILVHGHFHSFFTQEKSNRLSICLDKENMHGSLILLDIAFKDYQFIGLSA